MMKKRISLNYAQRFKLFLLLKEQTDRINSEGMSMLEFLPIAQERLGLPINRDHVRYLLSQTELKDKVKFRKKYPIHRTAKPRILPAKTFFDQTQATLREVARGVQQLLVAFGEKPTEELMRIAREVSSDQGALPLKGEDGRT